MCECYLITNPLGDIFGSESYSGMQNRKKRRPNALVWVRLLAPVLIKVFRYKIYVNCECEKSNYLISSFTFNHWFFWLLDH